MSQRPLVHVVRTGTANLASVAAGLDRVGADVALVEGPADVDAAAHLVLPGVGAFGAAMAELGRQRLVEPLRARVQAGRPTLCVCLGMQLLARESEEDHGVAGLGVLDTKVTRFDGDVRVPQLGWNLIVAEPEARLLREAYVYFANSYRLERAPKTWTAAWCEYGGPFVAALEHGAVLACQFHPELSGAAGHALLERWLERATEEAPC